MPRQYDREIDRYIGRDVWLLATSWRWNGTQYIRPLALVDGVLFHNRISESILDGQTTTAIFEIIHQYQTPWEDIEIIKPLQIYSTPEILDLVGLGH